MKNSALSDATTIAALATAPAPAGIAVIRISGPRTKAALRAIFKARHDPVDLPRQLIFGDVIDFKSSAVVDHALAVFMPGPNSYTGEDVGELQFHGSPLLVSKILRSLFNFGVSPAEAGEFTKRAFLNGKIDLVQAEAISDLINASNDQALKIAGEQLGGRFSKAIDEIGEPLRDALAQMEAAIDFPEEDIEPEKIELLVVMLENALQRIETLLTSYLYGHAVKEGFRVLLCGLPNVGKSSLLNTLLGKERAIVTEISGTTRDLIEEQAILGGYQFIFCDSAGITESTDKVEKIGIELAKQRVPWADLVLLVVDALDEKRHWEAVLNLLQGKAKQVWLVVNKIDLNPAAIGTVIPDSHAGAQNFYISTKSHSGIDTLQAALIDEVRRNLPNQGEASEIVTNERHRNCLIQAQEALTRAVEAQRKSFPSEIIAAEVRISLNALNEIVGKTYTEDILGRIFSKFCIGK